MGVNRGEGAAQGSVEGRLRDLGLALPGIAPQPVGAYRAWVVSGSLLFLSGQFPVLDGELRFRGRLGESVTDEEGCQAARLCALNALAHIRDAVGGDWARLGQVVQVQGHVQSTPGWGGHPRVLDGASDLLRAALGERRVGHARAAFGHTSLPMDAPVELVLVASVAP